MKKINKTKVREIKENKRKARTPPIEKEKKIINIILIAKKIK
jgi:hypothetical protein